MDDYRWFFKTIERVAEEELGSKYHTMVKKEDYFVDFLRYHIHSHSHFVFVFSSYLFLTQFCDV
jgi:hypothetical protein